MNINQLRFNLQPIAPDSPQLSKFIDLEYEASAPYMNYVFGDVGRAKRFSLYLISRGIGEFAGPRGQLVIDASDQVVGMAAWCAGSALRQARLQAAMAIATAPPVREDPQALQRMREAATTMMSVQNDDFYLSRLAVAAANRSSGIGGWLLSQFLEAARSAGSARAVLEVSSGAPAAERLYRRCGFQEIGRAGAEGPNGVLQYRHLCQYLHADALDQTTSG